MPDIMSLLSRRGILLGLGGTAVAAGGAMRFTSADEISKLLKPRGRGRRRVQLSTAARDDWAVQVGTLFTAETGHVLKLTDVQSFSEKSERPKKLRESAFVANFAIEKGGPLSDAPIYRIAHPEGGTFAIRLSAGSDPLRMHAVFN